MVLVVITPEKWYVQMENICHVGTSKHNIKCKYLLRNKKSYHQSLPEVFSTVDAREDLAVPTHVYVIFNLGFFQRFATGVAGEENHIIDTHTSLKEILKLKGTPRYQSVKISRSKSKYIFCNSPSLAKVEMKSQTNITNITIKLRLNVVYNLKRTKPMRTNPRDHPTISY